jgi:hypothetical protein
MIELTLYKNCTWSLTKLGIFRHQKSNMAATAVLGFSLGPYWLSLRNYKNIYDNQMSDIESVSLWL